MFTESFIVYIKTYYVYKDLAKVAETRFVTSNYELDRPLLKLKNKKDADMINFDDVTKENITDPNPNWQQISDYPYRVLIIGGSGSGKTNSSFNLISKQPAIDKFYLYAKDPYEPKYQFLIKKQESTGSKHLNNSKNFIEFLNNMDDIQKNIKVYSP